MITVQSDVTNMKEKVTVGVVLSAVVLAIVGTLMILAVLNVDNKVCVNGSQQVIGFNGSMYQLHTISGENIPCSN